MKRSSHLPSSTSPPFDDTTRQLACIRESQLYKTWMPLCQDSLLLHREGNADQIVWWKLGVRGLFAFDILLHAYGADCMTEDGSVRCGAWIARL